MITPKPIVANKLNNENVNVALIRATRLKSHDCIQIQDKSIQYSDNLLSVFTGAIETNSDITGELAFANTTSDIMITNQSLYIYREGLRVPMWYQHVVAERYYNTAARFANLTKASVQKGTEYVFVPQTSEEVVVRNTVKVEYGNTQTGPWTDVPSIHYVLDLGRRSVTPLSDAYNGKYFKISFYALNHDIAVVDQDDDDLDPKSFMIVLDKYKTNPGGANEFTEDTTNPHLNSLYFCTIYLSESPAMGETYTAKFRTIDENNVTEEREEILNPITIYEEISAFGSETRHDLKYVLASDYTISTKLCPYDTIFVRQVANRNSKIGLIEPHDVPHDQMWFVEVANQTATINGMAYSVLEENSYQRTNGLIVMEHSETARMITGAKIKTKYNDILSIRGSSGFSGISISTSGTDLTDFISDIDSKNGVIHLRGDFPFDHENTIVTYRSLHKHIPYQHLCLNAYRMYDQVSEYIADKYAVIFMLPESELNTAMGRSIFHFAVYRHPELIYGEVPTQKTTIDLATTYIEGTDGLGRSNLYSLIPTYINSGAGDTLHPVILGVISVTSPVTAASLEFIDVRRRGGGLPESEIYLEHLHADIRHNLDIAHIDAFEYNLENIAIVRVPRTILDDLIVKMCRYDTKTIRSLRIDPDYDVTKAADDYIRKEIKKYLRAGCHATLEYV